ncbi:MAG: roadblock/LC7 domain-containing protein [Verrucomicrobiales bacterium]|nr:roadblock/LC7 domain-containing protein [Verrucomicrobiales bacterium]
MATLPELLDEDVQEIETALKDFLTKSEATLALITAEGGFLIVQQGDIARFDSVTLGALSANAFNAAQAIAGILDERSFTHIYQQGDHFSMLVSGIDEHNTLVVLFPARVSVGAVKYYVAPTINLIATQLRKAQQRPSNRGLDLAMMNLADSADLFKRKDR